MSLAMNNFQIMIHLGSFEQICQRLRDTAISESARPKGVPRELIAAAKGVDFRDELLEIVNQVAIEIHGVFVSKSSTDHPQYNDLRLLLLIYLCGYFLPLNNTCLGLRLIYYFFVLQEYCYWSS